MALAVPLTLGMFAVTIGACCNVGTGSFCGCGTGPTTTTIVSPDGGSTPRDASPTSDAAGDATDADANATPDGGLTFGDCQRICGESGPHSTMLGSCQPASDAGAGAIECTYVPFCGT